MKTDAEFSKCRKYRYALWRTWDVSKPGAMFIGLNPATADENDNDNTVSRCISYAEDWGYGGLIMVNIFAFCTKDPDVMKAAKDPVGPENNRWLKQLCPDAGIVIAAWGNDGAYLGRSKEVVEMFPDLKCLKVNITGEPAHPLYQPRVAIPVEYRVE